jgi:hypothetical protein
MAEAFDPNVLTTAIQFWKKVYDEKEVIVKFRKKDGTDRIMRCTLDFNKIPIPDRPKSVNIEKILKLLQQNQIIHVYDLDKKAWRSVPFKDVEYLDTRKNRFYVKRQEKK